MSMMQMMLGAGGSGEETIEDWFSTTHYTGDPTSGVTVTNGIDLTGGSTTPGLVMLKRKDSTSNFTAWDTVRGVRVGLVTNSDAAQSTADPGEGLTAFNSNGFDLGADHIGENIDTGLYVSHTFRKAPNFFDIVSYTGNNPSNQTVPHGLECLPGMIICKGNNTSSWWVWHKNMSSSPNTMRIEVNNYIVAVADTYIWNSTAPTTTNFSVGYSYPNQTSQSYTAYVFAADEDNIKCGHYQGAYSMNNPGPVINLGWEPQFVMIKKYELGDGRGEASYNGWFVFDDQRTGSSPVAHNKALIWNETAAEQTGAYVDFTSTGFTVDPNGQGWGAVNYSSTAKFIYMAIRKPD
jgi:hypothetical protein